MDLVAPLLVMKEHWISLSTQSWALLSGGVWIQSLFEKPQGEDTLWCRGASQMLLGAAAATVSQHGLSGASLGQFLAFPAEMLQPGRGQGAGCIFSAVPLAGCFQ